jgi:hypothetical protein
LRDRRQAPRGLDVERMSARESEVVLE